MPWKRAKALGPPLLGIELFEQAERIQREACEAAGHHIPMVQENVRGAQKYVGRARWHYGSYYLWGDVPALMPFTHKAQTASVEGTKVGGFTWSDYGKPGYVGKAFNGEAARMETDDGVKVASEHGRRTDVGNGARFTSRDCGVEAEPVIDAEAGTKGYAARLGQSTIRRRHGSKSKARKAASARIAKIPAPLARWIAYCYLPKKEAE